MQLSLPPTCEHTERGELLHPEWVAEEVLTTELASSYNKVSRHNLLYFSRPRSLIAFNS